MILKRVKLINFRNLEKITLDVSPQINIFLGRNGQGKTNLLEALGFLSLGRSHRGNRDRELIRFGADHAHVSIDASDTGGDPIRLEAALTREGRKRIKIAGRPIARLADLVGYLPAVQFTPDEVELAKGSPERRRRFLDYTLSISSSDYFQHLLDYRRALAQKNRLLKQRGGVTRAQLEVWDEELVRCGAPLLRARARMQGPLERDARAAYEDLVQDDGSLELRIVSTVLPADADVDSHDPASVQAIAHLFREVLDRSAERERLVGHSLVGPHRDHVELRLRGKSLRRYGSQGEMRSASIALKLAQAQQHFERTEERPVIMLDDIFSELDPVRVVALQRRLHREHQLFIATARVEDVLGMADWEGLKVWWVEDGRLSPLPEINAATEGRR